MVVLSLVPAAVLAGSVRLGVLMDVPKNERSLAFVETTAQYRDLSQRCDVIVLTNRIDPERSSGLITLLFVPVMYRLMFRQESRQA